MGAVSTLSAETGDVRVADVPGNPNATAIDDEDQVHPADSF
jgi:hypothetical protein